MLPITYAIRNLFRDPGRLIQTVGGSALVVLLVIAATALTGGMDGVLEATGSERNVILLGAGSEESRRPPPRSSGSTNHWALPLRPGKSSTWHLSHCPE